MSKSKAWKAYKTYKKRVEIVDRLSDEGLTYTEAGRALRFAQEELSRRHNEETEKKVVDGGKGFSQTINVDQLSAEDVGRECKKAEVVEKEPGFYEKAQKFAEKIMDKPNISPNEVAAMPQLLEVLLKYGGAGEARGGKE